MTPVDADSPHRPRNRHILRHQKLLSYAHQIFSKPTGYVPLLIFIFLLGYFAHSQPLLSQSAFALYHHNRFPNQCKPRIDASQVRQTVLDRVFNGVSPWKGFPPDHVKPLLEQEWSKGWGSNAKVFERLIREAKPKIIIEIGTFLGASATHMAGLTRKLGLDSLILCIDDFRGWPGYWDEEQSKSVKMVNGDSYLLYQFMQNVKKANATDSILFLPFSAGTALTGLCDWGIYGDLVEVDAAHDFHSAWVDINNAYKVLRPGGILFGHDIVWAGVRRAVNVFARIHGFRVERDDEHWILY